MPIYHCPALMTKARYAQILKVQVRTVNDHIRQNFMRGDFKLATLDGDHYIFNPVMNPNPMPTGMVPEQMEWVHNFAQRNNIYFERVLEEIIKGNISGYIVCDRIYINRQEPQVIEYLAGFKRKRKKRVPYYMKKDSANS
jgi:hypothetical protein